MPKTSDEERRLAARLAEAFKELGFFIIQRGVDSLEDVMRLLRMCGAEAAVKLVTVGRSRGIYVLELRETGCRSRCAYEEGCQGDRSCMEECVESCLEALRQRIVEALRRLAG